MQSLDIRHMDMVRGEGDWRNMQPIVRSSFKSLYDQSSNQQKQIADLLEIAVNLKAQLALRPSLEDVKRIIDDKVRHTMLKADSKSRQESTLESLNVMRADLERKATIQYVDDSLRRKIDKGDALVKHLTSGGTELQQTLRALVKDETQKLAAEIGQIRNTQDMLRRSVTDLSRDVGSIKDLRAELNSVSRGLQEVTSALAVGALDPRVEQALQRKADRQDLDSIATLKVDRSALSVTLATIERALSDHERALTILRLRPPGVTGRGVTAEDEFDVPCSSMFAGGDVSGVVLEDAASEGGEIGRRIREGRDSAVFAALWQRTQTLEREVARFRAERRDFQGRIEALEEGLALSAGVAQAEALSVIIEELQRRIEDALPTLSFETNSLRESLVEQSKLIKEASTAAASLSDGTQSAASRISATEHALSSQAKALMLLDAQRKESYASVEDELKRAKARIAALERVQNRLNKSELELTVQALRGPRQAETLLPLSDSEHKDFASKGEAVGAAAVDAKIALLQAEKRRLRSDV